MVEQIHDEVEHALKQGKLSFTKEEKERPGYLIFLGTDAKDREYCLHCSVSDANLKFGKEEGQHLAQIEYLLRFPFAVKEHALFDCIRVINLLNTLAPIPGFEYQEVEQELCFRYVFIGPLTEETHFAILAMIGMISLYKDCYTDPLEKLANGVLTMEDVLSEFVDLSENLLQEGQK